MVAEEMKTLGVAAAASLLRISTDALMRKARAGIVPGAKIGREWVFVQADLIELIREQARELARGPRDIKAVLSAIAARQPSDREVAVAATRLRASRECDSRSDEERLAAKLAETKASPSTGKRKRANGGRFARTL
jgi:hypothetical protein